MSKLLQDATLAEIVAEVQRRNPDQIIELEIGTTYRIGTVPKSKQDLYEKQVKENARKAAIRLGWASCKTCHEQIREVEVCNCGERS